MNNLLKVSSNGNDFDLHIGGYRFEFRVGEGVRLNNLSQVTTWYYVRVTSIHIFPNPLYFSAQ